MKTLIVYYSYTQNNEKLAHYLQRQLICDLAAVETRKKRNGFSIFLDMLFKRKPALKPFSYRLRDYDHVIFLAPVWMGRIATPLTSFLMDEKQNIKEYSFITLCGGADSSQRGKQKANLRDELNLLTGKEPANLLELWVNDLISAEKKDKVRSTLGFQVEASQLERFQDQINEFLRQENLIGITR